MFPVLNPLSGLYENPDGSVDPIYNLSRNVAGVSSVFLGVGTAGLLGRGIAKGSNIAANSAEHIALGIAGRGAILGKGADATLLGVISNAAEALN